MLNQNPQYKEFFEFYQSCLDRPPWDNIGHPKGFPKEIEKVSSDISAHLPILQLFSYMSPAGCAEFGTRGCNSTAALIAGNPNKVTSYDLHYNETILKFMEWNKTGRLPCKWNFVQHNTLTAPPISFVDLLFLDSLHSYAQIKGELERHAHNVNKYLIFHDTSIWSQGVASVDCPNAGGINKAIDEYTKKNNWRLILEVQYNHGLRVYASENVQC